MKPPSWNLKLPWWKICPFIAALLPPFSGMLAGSVASQTVYISTWDPPWHQQKKPRHPKKPGQSMLKNIPKPKLGGGWTTPFEKYARQIASFPQVGLKIKNVWNHHLVNCSGIFGHFPFQINHQFGWFFYPCPAFNWVTMELCPNYSSFQMIDTWNPKQPFINGCFNWMIPNLYIGNGCFTKHLFINGCLGLQVLLQFKW